MTKSEAVALLRPGAAWVLRGDVLEWLDESQTQPTPDEIESTIAAHDYRDKRAAEYPPISDLADAIVHKENGDAANYDAYIAACNAVKAKYPKP